jgi:ribulokinase
MDAVIGIDGGTESLRAFVFDARGRPLGSGTGAYDTDIPKPGRAEQDPAAWWRALGEAVPAALQDAGVDKAEVRGIGLDTTSCTVVALDADGRALRPAIIWMDVRAAAEADAVLATGAQELRLNGGGHGPVSAEWMLPKALWLKRHEPETFDQAQTICEYQDYLIRHLTGRRVASRNNVAMRWHHAPDRPDGLLAALCLEELAAKWPDEIVPPGANVGGLTDAAAAHVGLAPGTPVAQGGADAFIGMIGLGVKDPGQLALVTGSSHLQLGVADRALHGPGIWGSYADAVYPGRHVVEGGQTSTGSIVAWFKRTFAPDADYDTLNREAAALPPGSEGVLVLDHFQGNRCPHTDPLSRGAVAGLSLGHGRGHLFRAIMEGVCFGTEAVLRTMRAAGFDSSEVVIAGGATRSPVWLQMHADVTGLPVHLPHVADAPSLGSAVLAAVAGGLYPELDTAVPAMTAVERTIQPDPEAHKRYAELYARYAELYPALKPTVHALQGAGG